MLFVATSEHDYRDLELNSDEKPMRLNSMPTSDLSVRRIIRDAIGPRLDRNTIREVTSKRGMPFHTDLADSGDPIPFTITYPTSIEEHERLSEMPLAPRKEKQTAQNAPKNEPKPASVDSKEHKRRRAVLKRILAKNKDLESFEAA